MMSLIRGLKYATNEPMKETKTDSQMSRLVAAKGWRVGEGWIGSLGLAEANYCI